LNKEDRFGTFYGLGFAGILFSSMAWVILFG